MKTKDVQGGIDRAYANSTLQKLVFSALHFFIVLLCIWLLFFDGLHTVGLVFDKELLFTDIQRAYVLLSCAFLYWIRHTITLFSLLLRKIEWGEVFGLIVFFILFEIGLLLIGGGVFREDIIPFNWLDILDIM